MSDVHNVAEVDSPLFGLSADLASRLTSRICHDLSNPIGAIANGLELLILSGAERTPEIDLISESVESANARLRFFRLAYGAASQQAVGRSEVVRILGALGTGSRLRFEWAVDGNCTRQEVKAVFLLIQCLETALPMGGRLRAFREHETWVVSAEGPRLRIDGPGWRAFGSAGMAVPESAVEVPFALLASSLQEVGRSLSVSSTPDRIDARF